MKLFLRNVDADHPKKEFCFNDEGQNRETKQAFFNWVTFRMKRDLGLVDGQKQNLDEEERRLWKVVRNRMQTEKI